MQVQVYSPQIIRTPMGLCVINVWCGLQHFLLPCVIYMPPCSFYCLKLSGCAHCADVLCHVVLIMGLFVKRDSISSFCWSEWFAFFIFLVHRAFCGGTLICVTRFQINPLCVINVWCGLQHFLLPCVIYMPPCSLYCLKFKKIATGEKIKNPTWSRVETFPSSNWIESWLPESRVITLSDAWYQSPHTWIPLANQRSPIGW